MWLNHSNAKEVYSSLPRDLIMWHLFPWQHYSTPGTGSWSDKSLTLMVLAQRKYSSLSGGLTLIQVHRYNAYDSMPIYFTMSDVTLTKTTGVSMTGPFFPEPPIHSIPRCMHQNLGLPFLGTAI